MALYKPGRRCNQSPSHSRQEQRLGGNSPTHGGRLIGTRCDCPSHKGLVAGRPFRRPHVPPTKHAFCHPDPLDVLVVPLPVLPCSAQPQPPNHLPCTRCRPSAPPHPLDQVAHLATYSAQVFLLRPSCLQVKADCHTWQCSNSSCCIPKTFKSTLTATVGVQQVMILRPRCRKSELPWSIQYSGNWVSSRG